MTLFFRWRFACQAKATTPVKHGRRAGKQRYAAWLPVPPITGDTGRHSGGLVLRALEIPPGDAAATAAGAARPSSSGSSAA
jgi:hypothetical protein